MKKVVSLILTLAVIFAMSTTAFAAPVNVVGNRGTNDDYTDGADKSGNSFTSTHPANCEVDINVTLTSTVNKYAVDMEYDASALSLGGGVLTWDVNTMTYVTTTQGSDPAVTTKTVKIINYSDLPVQAYATIADSDDTDGLVLASNYTDSNKLQIDRAIAGTGGNNGTATEKEITITLTASTTWQAVVEHYTNKGSTGTVTVATATITVEPVA